jgi:hypothetical protein
MSLDLIYLFSRSDLPKIASNSRGGIGPFHLIARDGDGARLFSAVPVGKSTVVNLHLQCLVGKGVSAVGVDAGQTICLRNTAS